MGGGGGCNAAECCSGLTRRIPAAAVHHVLAQRCGTQVTLAALLLSLLQRLEKALGRDLDFAVLAPNDYTMLPSACVRAEASFLGVESRDLVVKVLRSLKRGYWPWAWLPDGRAKHCWLADGGCTDHSVPPIPHMLTNKR